jgi:hypothetical protein
MVLLVYKTNGISLRFIQIIPLQQFILPSCSTSHPRTMKLTSFKTSLFLAGIFLANSLALPSPDEATNAIEAGSLAPAACGAAGSCHGFGGEELCNDRVRAAELLLLLILTCVQCKKCTDNNGIPYKKGECCGTAWQYVFPVSDPS